MTSYNNIKKIQYTSYDENEPISLREYIDFTNDENNEKYVLLKFKNRITQRLFGFKFIIYSYDISNNLIEKSTYNYGNLSINENESFVLDKKIKIPYDTNNIKVEIVFAKYETMEYNNGEFNHVQYTFEEYLNKNREEPKVKNVEKTVEKVKKKEIKRKQKILKKGYTFDDITNINYNKKPIIFTSIIALIVTIFAVFNVFTVSSNATYFTIGDFDYSLSSSNTLTIVNYRGDDRKVVIPSIVQDCVVTEIAPSAFKDNQNIETIAFEDLIINNRIVKDEIIIRTNAFNNLSKLTKIIGENRRVNVGTMAFKDCPNIDNIILTYGYINNESFHGLHNLQNLKIYDLSSSELRYAFSYNNLEYIQQTEKLVYLKISTHKQIYSILKFLGNGELYRRVYFSQYECDNYY